MAPVHLRPLLAALALFGLSTPALSLGLGDATPASALGEPLRLNIPVELDPGEPLGEHCFRLRDARSGKTAEVPAITGGSVTVRRTGVAAAILEVSTREAIDEPMVALGIETRCGVNLTRDYAVLLSPRSADTPTHAAGGALLASPTIPAAMPPTPAASGPLAVAQDLPAARPRAPAARSTPNRQAERPADPPPSPRAGRPPVVGDPVLRASLSLSWPASPRTLARSLRRERGAASGSDAATLAALAAEVDQLRQHMRRQEQRWHDGPDARAARSANAAAAVTAMPASLSFPLARGEAPTVYRLDMPPPASAAAAPWSVIGLAVLLTALVAGLGGYQAHRLLAARAAQSAPRRRPVRRRPRA